MKKYITVSQAARKLGVSPETIYNYCKKGVLGGQYIRVNKKGNWKIDVDSIRLLIEKSSFKSSMQIKKEMQINLFEGY